MNNQKPIHYCCYASQPDIQIACTQEWTTPAWGPQPDLPNGVCLADNDMLYTFRSPLVSCQVCKDWLKE